MRPSGTSWAIILFTVCSIALVILWVPQVEKFFGQKFTFDQRNQNTENQLFPYGTSWSLRTNASVRFSGGYSIHVELAQTPEEQEKGLSGHAQLGWDAGLLFLHERRAQQRYWMKDMLFPIDIIWIDGNTIIGFVEHAQPETPVSTIYTSPAPVDRVLEVRADFVRVYQIRVGDQLDIEFQDQ
jgi:hypothetical protein